MRGWSAGSRRRWNALQPISKRRPVQFELPLLDRCREPVTRAHVVLEGRIVEYTLRRSARCKSITLTIDERGLRVGAPWRAGENAIVGQLRRHAAWVLRKLEEWSRRRTPPRRWRDGETIMLLGAPLRLTLHSRPRPPELDEGRLMVGCAAQHETALVETQVGRWLREQALACFVERVARYVPLLGVSVPDIRLSNARSRWGSCHPAGYIHLNWRLIHLPLPLLDYVVVHELAHLKELNHSARFWRIVAQIIPDHAERRTEIRARAHEYLAG
jgi:predicted metal-dependent hydrolase